MTSTAPSLHLIRLGDAQLAEMPKAYVQALFDQYAPRFEHTLVNDLDYRAPSLIFKAVVAARVAAKKPALFKRAIDLGCGTGLAAAAFAKQVDHFIGIDLSPGMIKEARATELYAELEVADMIEGLRRRLMRARTSSSPRMPSSISPISRRCSTEVKRVLVSGGVLAFTLETHDGDGIILGEGLRYAHSAEYVRGAIAKAGLKLLTLEPASPRIENNEPVRGLVVVAEKT